MNDAWSIMDIVDPGMWRICTVCSLCAEDKGEDHQDISCVQGDGCEYL